MTEDQMQAVQKELTAIDCGALTAALVRIPSYSFLENQEKAIAAYIRDVFLAEGIPAEAVEVAPGRYNCIATIKGTGGGRSLMLCGHLDTVPAYEYDDADPFSGRIENGRVFGRGSCDMKGGCAAMMAAMIALHRVGVRLAGDIVFGGVADEEELGLGVKHIIEHGPHTDAVIVGEPTDLTLRIGQKGLEWINVEVTGKQVHSSEMENGINAIVMASRFIERVESRYQPVLAAREHPILGFPTLNFATIHGGTQCSTVPGSCTITFDRRSVPGESIAQVYGELQAIIDELHAEDPRFSATVTDQFAGNNNMPHNPYVLAEDDPIITATQRALRAYNLPDGTDVCGAWTDAGFIAGETSASCIVFGPGEGGYGHTPDESVSIKELERGAALFAIIAADYCK